VRIVDISGVEQMITVRELLDKSTGPTYDALEMLDEWPRLCKEYDEEQRARYELEHRDEFLPLGSHLLPKDYEDFLYSWNKEIASREGEWLGSGRAAFKKNWPEDWAAYLAENRRFIKLYAAEVAKVKAYQAEHKDDPSSPVAEETPYYIPLSYGVLPKAPPLPSSPRPLPVPVAMAEPVAEPVAVAEPVPVAMAEPVPVAEPEQAPRVPVKPRNPHYNHYNWPSPLAKAFVQQIRGRNAWNHNYWRFSSEGAWSNDFKASWLMAGNTEFKLTHENCLHYLAYRCNCSVDEFLLKKPADVNSKLFSPYSGVKGHYVNRYYY